jgi:molybdenum cofactor cytidylyltransferase
MRNPGLIILAAGGSSRMGSPKQLLPWKGGTLLKTACEVALKTGCEPVIAVLGCESATCLKELDGLNVAPVINPDWKRGMGSSLAIGITHLKQAAPDSLGAMIMLVDQPIVTPNFLGQLSKIWRDSSQSIVATRYSHGGGVPAIFPKSYFEELEKFDSDQGARTLIAREKANTQLVNFEDELIDIDDQTTYQKLCEKKYA